MLRHLLAVCWVVSITALYGCSGITGVNAYVNKQYQNKPRFPNKLAIVPLTRLGPPLACPGKCPPLEQVSDESFEKSFKEFSGKVALIPMAKTRRFFDSNPNLLNRLLGLKYSEEDLSNNPGIQTTLDSEELATLRERLENADLLLVPSKLDLVPRLGGIFGYSEFRLYDLGVGSMIYSASRNMNVNQGDEPGRGLMAIVLLGMAAEDFEKLYLSK